MKSRILNNILRVIRIPLVGMILRFAVALILLWWVAKGLNFSALSALSARQIFCWGAAALLCVLCQVTLSAWRWRLLLLGQGIDLPLMRSVSLTFQGCMFSLFMPGGAVGGDVLKAAVLTRETRTGRKVEGITTIFLDRVIGMMALFLLAFLLGVFNLPSIQKFSADIRWLTLFLLAVCPGGFCAGAVLLFQDLIFQVKFLAYLLSRADSLVHGKLTRILASVEVCRRNRRTLLIAFLVSFAVLHPMLIMAAILILRGVTGDFSAWKGALFSIALGNVASAAPVTPGGLGTRDKVIELLLESFGVSAQASSLTPILFSSVLIVSSSLGFLFFLLGSVSAKKQKS